MEVYRTATGRVLTVVITTLCTVGLVAITLQRGPLDGLRTAPFLAFTAGLCWALFAHPCVKVDLSGVTLVNVMRTVMVPWPAIIDVETRWGLTLVTAYGRRTAWAAPSPGAAHVLRTSPRTEGRNLPASTYHNGSVRPGDLPTSPSGHAALLVRARWEDLKRRGVLDEPRLEFDRLPTRWHCRSLATGGALMALCLVSLLW